MVFLTFEKCDKDGDDFSRFNCHVIVCKRNSAWVFANSGIQG